MGRLPFWIEEQKNPKHICKLVRCLTSTLLTLMQQVVFLIFWPRTFHNSKVLNNSWNCNKLGKRNIKNLWHKGCKAKVWSGIQSMKKNYQNLLTTTKPLLSKWKVKHCRYERKKIMNRILVAFKNRSEIYRTYEFSVFHL